MTLSQAPARGSSPPSSPAFDPHDADNLDPSVRRVLTRRAARKRASGPYTPLSIASVETLLERFLAEKAPGARIRSLGRLGGGASKEQFSFWIDEGHAAAGRYVLRMEPVQSISESDRRLEFEVIDALRTIVPAPEPAWLDAEGEYFGQPAALFHFVGGVIKPSDVVAGVTGLGIVIGERLRPILKPQFIDHLAAIHAFDWRTRRIGSLGIPASDPREAALWQVNWWSRVWKEDCTQSLPIVALAERWLRANLPATDEFVLVHGDYRTGNFLFDEETGRISAVLDWELCHLGDFHEDLAWSLQRLFGTVEDGRQLAGGLVERDEFIALYEAASGRRINRGTLHFYEVFAAFKCIVITMATGVKATRDQHNHQEILLSWLAAIGHIFAAELAELLKQERPA